MVKICNRCNNEKDETLFKKNGRGGIYKFCKLCSNKSIAKIRAEKKWIKKNTTKPLIESLHDSQQYREQISKIQSVKHISYREAIKLRSYLLDSLQYEELQRILSL